MKRKLFFSFGVLFLSTLVLCGQEGPSYQEAVLQDTPLAYWRLGEQGEGGAEPVEAVNRGSLGEAGDGTLLNGVILRESGAISEDDDTTVQFTQSAQSKIDVAWAPELNPEVFTIEVWARVTGGSS